MSNYHCTNNCAGACVPPSQPQGHGCLRGDSFRQALQLLCRSPISAAINFSAFSFISSHYLLGTPLKIDDGQAGDNLEAPAACYFCSDGCEEPSVSGALYGPVPGARGLCTAVHQVHLCNLTAISFDAMADPAGGTDPFQIISQGFTRLLQPCSGCTQAAVIAAGPLVVEQADVLGQIGNLLVVSNAADRRFYFICTQKIDFLG